LFSTALCRFIEHIWVKVGVKYSNIYPTRCNVTQFPDKINSVTLHLVGYILEYYYDARTHER